MLTRCRRRCRYNADTMRTVCILQINAERLLKNADRPRPLLLFCYPSSGPLGPFGCGWVEHWCCCIENGLFSWSRRLVSWVELGNLVLCIAAPSVAGEVHSYLCLCPLLIAVLYWVLLYVFSSFLHSSSSVPAVKLAMWAVIWRTFFLNQLHKDASFGLNCC